MGASGDASLADDIAAIARIDAVPTMLEVVCRTTGMRFAAIARVTDQRWIACAVRDEIAFGLVPGGELEVETTICSEIRDSGKLVVIDEVATDTAFCGHPTPRQYGFQSYISVPIYRASGEFFGTLCAIDPRPARVNNSETIGMFTLFANLIAFHLDSQDRLATSELSLRDERQAALLREQFIAVLGHDLRNPLASIDATAKALLMMSGDGQTKDMLRRIERSGRRMQALIDDVMDFARGRLGGGLRVNANSDDDLGQALSHAVAELQSAWPTRAIDVDIALARPVFCDARRVAQLLSNLLGNALVHGDATQSVRVSARSDDNGFELAVVNHGEPIPQQVLGRLFQPFWRGAGHTGREGGLGLGLFIASEIARAHGGTLDVESLPAETRFTFRMPSEVATLPLAYAPASPE